MIKTQGNSRMIGKCSQRGKKNRLRGFSVVELLMVVIVVGVIAGFAVPFFLTISRNLRTSGDARDIHGAITLAKMRAASGFTKARMYADLPSNTFRIEKWDKTAASWQTEGGSQSLSRDVNWGYGSLSSPPTGTQSSIGQAPVCRNNAGANIANTACVVFNSRGIPIIDSTGVPTGNGALYANDGSSVYGLTISATGLIRIWRTDIGAANWVKR